LVKAEMEVGLGGWRGGLGALWEGVFLWPVSATAKGKERGMNSYANLESKMPYPLEDDFPF